MKSIYKRVLVLLILGAVFMPVFAAGNKNQYVSVGSAQVKAKASQFAKTVATLKYGDEVIIVEAKKEWSNIKSLDGKVEGWVPNSSLTTKKLIVKVKSNKGTSANAEELALAGKGWSEWFEQALESTAIPLSGIGIFNFSIMWRKRSRSSAMSIESIEVPKMFTPFS